jgi:hypothetical protein
MSTLTISEQLQFQLSVPNLSPARNPKLAAKFDKLAASMEKTVQAKLHPAISQQNITARRAQIGREMRAEGQRLALVQNWLEQLAECHRNGTCPAQFASIANRVQLMDFATIYQWQHERVDGHNYLQNAFDHNYEIVSRLALLGVNTAEEAIAAVELLESLGTNLKIEIDHAIEMAQNLRRQAIFNRVPDFFPTPAGIIERMLEIANIEPWHKVLDPSAGGGDICVAVRNLGVPNVHCFEIDSTLIDALTLFGFAPHGRDFLTATPRPIYDRVLMNPPYSKDAYIQHVRNAYQWLIPGGELIAVLPNEYQNSSIKKRREFADWLDAIGAECYPNPADAFTKSDRSCGVSTHLIHLKR